MHKKQKGDFRMYPESTTIANAIIDSIQAQSIICAKHELEPGYVKVKVTLDTYEQAICITPNVDCHDPRNVKLGKVDEHQDGGDKYQEEVTSQIIQCAIQFIDEQWDYLRRKLGLVLPRDQVVIAPPAENNALVTDVEIINFWPLQCVALKCK